MKYFARIDSRLVSLVLAGALLMATAPVAQAKQITPIQVHARILKRGIGNWVAVELSNGTAFAGRIVIVDDKTFSLQLHNDPSITDIAYSDVVNLRTGVSSAGVWAILIAGVGGSVALAAIGLHNIHSHEQLPTLPAQRVMQ